MKLLGNFAVSNFMSARFEHGMKFMLFMLSLCVLLPCVFLLCMLLRMLLLCMLLLCVLLLCMLLRMLLLCLLLLCVLLLYMLLCVLLLCMLLLCRNRRMEINLLELNVTAGDM